MINQLAAWELFKAEIERNLEPNEEETRQMFKPLLDKGVIDGKCYDALCLIRQMAAYEEAIVRFSHPKLIFKQASVKAESLHFGTLYETVIKYYLIYKNKQKKGNMDDIIKVDPKETFNKLIQTLKVVSGDLFDESYFKLLHNLRNERNKVHYIEAYQIPEGEVPHEEYRLIEYRIKFKVLLNKIIKSL
jgi:hypothetical protein